MSSPISNWNVGERYLIKPIVDKGILVAAIPNQNNGRAVAGPPIISSASVSS